MGIAAIVGAITEPSSLAAMFGFKPNLIGPAGAEMLIDIIEAENVEYSFEISSDPVECGTEIADLIIDKPVAVTLDCVFTDLQLSAKALAAAAISSNFGLSTWRDKKDALYKIKDAKGLINISTPLHFYQNYLIESVSPSATAQSGNCFRCRIVARSVNIVASLIGFIDPSLLPVELQAVSETKGASKKTSGASKKTAPTSNAGAAETSTSTRSATQKGNTVDAYGYNQKRGI